MPKHKSRFKIFLIIAIVMLALAVAAWWIIDSRPQPPIAEIAMARERLSLARAANANIYLAADFGEASALYDSANGTWKAENERFFLSRNYDRTRKFAQLSAQKSEQIEKKARTYSYDLKTTLKKRISTLRNKTVYFDNHFSDLPLDKEVRHSFQSAVISLTEAETAYKAANYLLCHEKTKIAADDIDFIYTQTRNTLEDYFGNFNVWIERNNEALRQSKTTGDFVLVVSKFQKKCFVYHRGEQVDELDIELGKNWIGDKRHRGDKATPEGKYKVTTKKSGKQTKYYKALLIDFPNNDDRKRFDTEKKNGTLPHHADIGGLIEIHGDGGRGIDWTDGCVALTNENMDWLYARTKTGTPVYIIGSLVPLEKLVEW
jgi:hypothetical protein